jgi:hypothetical protein
MLGGFGDDDDPRPPVETFQSLREQKNLSKIMIARKPLKRGQVIDYFTQMREVSKIQNLTFAFSLKSGSVWSRRQTMSFQVYNQSKSSCPYRKCPHRSY